MNVIVNAFILAFVNGDWLLFWSLNPNPNPNKEAKSREFKPGDKVLVLLPIPGSSLQARYCGPYLVQQTIGD